MGLHIKAAMIEPSPKYRVVETGIYCPQARVSPRPSVGVFKGENGNGACRLTDGSAFSGLTGWFETCEQAGVR